MQLGDVKLGNQTLPFDFLSNKVKQLRPDLTCIRDNTARIEVIEGTVPFATMDGQEDALERAYIEKLKKHATLLDELSMFNITQTTVVVSSLGAFYTPSITKFGTLLRCNQLKLKNYLRSISKTAIVMSYSLWTSFKKNNSENAIEPHAEEEDGSEEDDRKRETQIDQVIEELDDSDSL
jgi:hypothetical protein